MEVYTWLSGGILYTYKLEARRLQKTFLVGSKVGNKPELGINIQFYLWYSSPCPTKQAPVNFMQTDSLWFVTNDISKCTQ